MTSKQSQSQALASLIDITQATTSDAQRLLKLYRWNVQQAVEGFYTDPQAMRNAEKQAQQAQAQLTPQLTQMFDKYAAAHPSGESGPNAASTWGFDATLAWCADLEVDPAQDAAMLGVAEMCKATEMGVFERKEWVQGWAHAKCATIAQQRSHITHLREELSSNPNYYRKIYNFAFDYAREIKTQRSLPLETAEGMWDLILPLAPNSIFEPESCWNATKDEDTASDWLAQWKSYLSADDGGKKRPVSKDVWSQFLDFVTQMDSDFAAHDPDNDAWPSLIDGFVEYTKKKQRSKDMEED